MVRGTEDSNKFDQLFTKKKANGKKSEPKNKAHHSIQLVVRKGGKDYLLRAPPQLQNMTKLKQLYREKKDIVNMTMGSASIHTQNEALISKSVDSSNNDRNIAHNFETERMNNPNVIFNQFKTFSGTSHTYTNNLER
jgi:hypothetical protein